MLLLLLLTCFLTTTTNDKRTQSAATNNENKTLNDAYHVRTFVNVSRTPIRRQAFASFESEKPKIQISAKPALQQQRQHHKRWSNQQHERSVDVRASLCGCNYTFADRWSVIIVHRLTCLMWSSSSSSSRLNIVCLSWMKISNNIVITTMLWLLLRDDQKS